MSGDAARGAARSVLKRMRSNRPGERLAAIAAAQTRPSAEVVDELGARATDLGEDPVVRAAAIAALARAGLSTVVEPDAPPSVWSAVEKAARITKTRDLIAAFDRGDPRARPPDAILLAAADFGIVIEQAALAPSEKRRIVAATSLPGADPVSVQGLQCAGRELAIIFRPEQVDASKLARAPAHPAQIAVHHIDEVDAWTVRYDVLSSPLPDGIIALIALDERGASHFAGSARAAGDEVVFEMHAVHRPGAVPLTLHGHTDRGELAIDRAWTGTRGVAPRRPSRG
jgi:hypothetical protein